MDAPRAATDGGRDHSCQFLSGAQRARRHDGPRHSPRQPLLTIPIEKIGQPVHRPLVHDVGRGRRPLSGHAHIERALRLKGETTLRAIQLQRRDAQVEQNTVDPLEPCTGSQRRQIAKVPLPQHHSVSEGCEFRGSMVERCAVPIDAEQMAVRPAPLQDAPGVASRADCAVDPGAAWTDLQTGQDLIVQDGHVQPVPSRRAHTPNWPTAPRMVSISARLAASVSCQA